MPSWVEFAAAGSVLAGWALVADCPRIERSVEGWVTYEFRTCHIRPESTRITDNSNRVLRRHLARRTSIYEPLKMGFEVSHASATIVRDDTNPKAGTRPEPEVLGRQFADSPHPMWIFDRETHVFLDVNGAAVRQYGYSRQEFLAMTILDIRPTPDISQLLRQGRDSRLQGRSTAEKLVHQAKDRTVFPVTITSWQLTFRGRQAELVLARREGAKNEK